MLARRSAARLRLRNQQRWRREFNSEASARPPNEPPDRTQIDPGAGNHKRPKEAIMRGGSFKLGRAFGIDVKVHWTFLLLLLFFAGYGYAQSGNLFGALLAAGFVVVLFVFVVLHEYGHSLVAQRLGIEVRDITLLPIGGLARMSAIPEKPSDEVKVAIAGPLVNVVLAAILYGIAYLGLGSAGLRLPDLTVSGASLGSVLSYLAFINVILAGFNFIPAFPMDGGRVLRGLLATRMGVVRATKVAAVVGQGFAFLFFFYGLLSGNFILILIAAFVFFGAGAEAQLVRQRELMRGLSVRDVMAARQHTETVTPYHTFGQVLDAVIHGYQEDFPVVDEDGNLAGMLTRREILAAAHSPGRFYHVRDLMKTRFPTLSPGADLFGEGYRLLQESELRALPVVEGGKLVGMLTIEDIGHASLLREQPTTRR